MDVKKWYLLGLLKSHTKSIVLLFILILIKVFAVVSIPLLYKMGFDTVIYQHVVNPYLYLAAIVALIVFFVSSTFIYRTLQKISRDVFNKLHEKLYGLVATLPIEHTRDFHTIFNVENIFHHKLNNLEQALNQTIPDLIFYILQIISCLIIMSIFNWKLTIFIGFLLVVTTYLPKQNIIFIRKYEKLYKKCNDKLLHLINALIERHRIISIFGLNHYWKSHFEKMKFKVLSFSKKYHFYVNKSNTSNFIYINIFFITVSFVCSALILYHQLTVGETIAFFFLLTIINTSLSAINRATSPTLSLLNNIIDVEHFILDTTYPSHDVPSYELQEKITDIRFENVGLTIQGVVILENITFHIQEGQSIALTGSSGGGKSTILDLLMGIHKPTSGKIYINNMDINFITPASLHKQFAVIFQESDLFNETIYKNIQFGNLLASEENIVESAKLSHIHEDILHFPYQYRTYVDYRSTNLSGGQKQRIAIARALVKDFSVLILDEATSALDSKNETEINQTIENITKDKIYISATHRLNAITHMDQIFLIQNHTIAERGTHEELLAKNHLYRQLWEKQNFAKVLISHRIELDLNYLRKINLLSHLSHDMLSSLKEYFQLEEVSENMDVIRYGEIGKKFYMIAKGMVKVTGPSIKEPITLEEGDNFGEIALIKNIRRTATIQTITPCTFITLDQKDFNAFIQQDPTLYERIMTTATLRQDGKPHA